MSALPVTLAVEPTSDPEQFAIVVSRDDRRVLADEQLYVRLSGYYGPYSPQLFAAAPELLDLIRVSIGNVRSLGPAGALAQVHTPYQEWLAQLEAAYTKATGEAA